MLASALLNASSGLTVASEQLDVVSRNIARNGDPNAVGKVAKLTTTPSGGALVSCIDRTSDPELLKASLDASSAVSGQTVTDESLAALQSAIGQVSDERSPAALISKLQQALTAYAANPAQNISADAVINSAKALAQGLNSASAALANVKSSIASQIDGAVDDVNSLLAQFGKVNQVIVTGTAAGQDVTDQLDQRDALLKSLAQDLGVRAVLRRDSDMALYTDSGVTLFDKSPRTVALQQSAGANGGSVTVDGVVVAGPGQTMALGDGKLRALVDFRDGSASTFGTQLDEIARGIINAFAEQPNSSGTGLPDVPGLFTVPGMSVVPGSASTVANLAASITVSAAYDPAQGGTSTLLRDAGSGGTAYIGNPSGQTGDTSQVLKLIDALSAPQAFATTGIATNADVVSYSAASVGWLADLRQKSSDALTYASAVQSRSVDALSAAAGVSLDQEMSHMMSLENSYQASSRLVTTINDLFKQMMNNL